jgi:hypothetical protein
MCAECDCYLLWMCVLSAAAAGCRGCVNVCRVQLLLAVDVCVFRVQLLLVVDVCVCVCMCVQSAAAAGCACVCRVQLQLAVDVCV